MPTSTPLAARPGRPACARPATGPNRSRAATGPGDGVVPVAVSRLVAPLLTGPARAATVLGAWPRCLYLRLADPAGDVVIPVVTADALALPGAVRLARPSSAGPAWGVAEGDRVRVGDGRIVLPGQVLAARRTWAPPRVRPAEVFHPAARGLLAGAGPGPGRPGPGAAATRLAGALFGDAPAEHAGAAGGAALQEAVAELAGRGPGLTPSGDDVVTALALLAVALDGPTGARPRRLRAAWAGVADATSTLSASLVRDALAGYGTAPLVGCVDALTGAQVCDAAHLRDRVDAVLRIGHTSGADLLLGLAAGLSALTSPTERTTR